VPFDGEISLGDAGVMPGTPRPWLAWAGQRPGLLAGTIADNVSLGEASVDPALVHRALGEAGAGELDPSTRLGVNGDGLSGGQAQRVAVARAIYRARLHGCRVLVLDEPSSALDPEAEKRLVTGLRSLATDGLIVIVVSHRPLLRDAADQVVELNGPARV